MEPGTLARRCISPPAPLSAMPPTCRASLFRATPFRAVWAGGGRDVSGVFLGRDMSAGEEQNGITSDMPVYAAVIRDVPVESRAGGGSVVFMSWFFVGVQRATPLPSPSPPRCSVPPVGPALHTFAVCAGSSALCCVICSAAALEGRRENGKTLPTYYHTAPL